MSAVSDQAVPPAPYFPVLTFRLLWRFWPQLTVLWLVGMIAEDVLNEIAVRIGFLNQLAGLSTLTLVVLAKLVVLVAMFEIVRPGLPALDAASRAASQTRVQETGQAREQFTATLALALVPFLITKEPHLQACYPGNRKSGSKPSSRRAFSVETSPFDSAMLKMPELP